MKDISKVTNKPVIIEIIIACILKIIRNQYFIFFAGWVQREGAGMDHYF